MRHLIVDLEATCWSREGPDGVRWAEFQERNSEIIEIGAVLVTDGAVERDFTTFVKPTSVPQLSPYCTNLTSIRQEDVDAAETFDLAFPRFVRWVGLDPAELVFGSWGEFDRIMLQKECLRHGLTYPFVNHVNLKSLFAETYRCKPRGAKRALKKLKLTPEGTPHRGIDDARNIARIFLKMQEPLSK